MNKLNIDHLLTLYKRSDTSRLPVVSTASIADAVRKSRPLGIKALFDFSNPFRFVTAMAGAVCGIFLLTFFLVTHPIHKDTNIAIDISRDTIIPLNKVERAIKKDNTERLVYIGKDGRDVSVKL